MDEPNLNYYQHTVTDDYLKKVTRVEIRRRFRNPFTLLLIVLQVGILIWATFLFVRSGTPLTFVVVVVSVVILYWQTLGVRFRYKSALGRMTPLGTTYGVEIGSAELGLVGPTTRSKTAYSVVSGAKREGDLVVIGYRDGLHAYYPESMLPQKAIDQINAAAAYYRGS